jgi:hypothetical protein
MGRMLTAIEAALDGRTDVDPRDTATERLALGYAELIDSAAPAAKYRKALAVISRAIAGTTLEDDDPFEAFTAISTALAEHSVASDLGPKLLATLTSLGLTTAARGEQKGVKRSAPANPLDELRKRRDLRAQSGA